ncbi:hypothetical protein [Ornithinimicrobium kibberense]|uniref:hypothetical protein n=1 Tax=Ornithinimicrobium kibberense TaxID=282060 RepID=UPI003612313E
MAIPTPPMPCSRDSTTRSGAQHVRVSDSCEDEYVSTAAGSLPLRSGYVGGVPPSNGPSGPSSAPRRSSAPSRSTVSSTPSPRRCSRRPSPGRARRRRATARATTYLPCSG